METKVLSAFRLWYNNLLDNAAFFDILMKIKGQPVMPVNSDNITEKQKIYIGKLKEQGKIPKDLKVDGYTKLEAQVLIQQALIGKLTPHNAETIQKEPIHNAQAIPTNIPKDLEELYNEGDVEW
jgi:hypothetical protein